MSAPESTDSPAEIQSYKGFDLALKCREHSFVVGQSCTLDGKIVCCQNGYHACEHPLDVLGYYPAGQSRYARVTQSGDLSRDGSDSKVASRTIRIDEEITLEELIEAAITKTIRESIPSGAASATGYSGAASATGDRGRVCGAEGCALFLVYRDEVSGDILHAWAGIAGRNGIKPLTWYQLDSDGKPQEVES